jgi:hypothetical protein
VCSVKACSQLGSLINGGAVDACCGNAVWSFSCSTPLPPPRNHRVVWDRQTDRARRRNLCEIPQIGSLSKLSGSAACYLERHPQSPVEEKFSIIIAAFRLSPQIAVTNIGAILDCHCNIHTHTHVRTYKHTHTHVHTCIHTFIHTYTHTHIHTYTHAYLHTYIRTHT